MRANKKVAITILIVGAVLTAPLLFAAPERPVTTQVNARPVTEQDDPGYIGAYPPREERVRTIVPENSIERVVLAAADEFWVPRDVALALVQQESGGRITATSPVGAAGLAQVMPSTAAAIAAELGVKEYDIYDPATNARFGMFYLAEQWRKFGSLELALAAYNAGPGAVAKYSGVPPYRETQGYVAAIAANKDRIYDLRVNRPNLNVFERGYRITQGISEGNHTGDGYDNGVDVIPVSAEDTAVRATLDGTVFQNGYNEVGGYYIIVRSPSGRYLAYYGHLAEQSPLVVGTVVEYGKVLGQVGATGEATGPHTHTSYLFSEDGGETYRLYSPE